MLHFFSHMSFCCQSNAGRALVQDGRPGGCAGLAALCAGGARAPCHGGVTQVGAAGEGGGRELFGGCLGLFGDAWERGRCLGWGVIAGCKGGVRVCGAGGVADWPSRGKGRGDEWEIRGSSGMGQGRHVCLALIAGSTWLALGTTVGGSNASKRPGARGGCPMGGDAAADPGAGTELSSREKGARRMLTAAPAAMFTLPSNACLPLACGCNIKQEGAVR